MPKPPSEHADSTAETITFSHDDEDADKTMSASSDCESNTAGSVKTNNDAPTLESVSDVSVVVVSDADYVPSDDSEIPTGYNSETGELYQNQESDPIVRKKMSRYFYSLQFNSFVAIWEGVVIAKTNYFALLLNYKAHAIALSCFLYSFIPL